MAKLKDAKLKDLVFDNKNFNKHTEFGMSLIEKSLRSNGAGRSILIDKHNRIIAGNGVTEVAGQIGLDDVQIVETDGTKIIAVKRTDIDLDTKQGREMALADNATGAADLQWDADAIADVESEFDIDASAWGVDVDLEDDAEQPTASEDDFDENTDAIETRCKKGDVWLLGNHRLMCGDSTSAEDVARLMGGEKADITFTSPPYNAGCMNIEGQERTGKKYNEYDDNKTESQYIDFLRNNLEILVNVSNEVFYNLGVVAGSKTAIISILYQFKDYFKDFIYWEKSNPVNAIAHGVISSSIELIICLGKNNSRRFDDTHFENGEYYLGVIKGSVASNNEYSKIHRATFPVYLPENIIRNFTSVGKVVLDCFGGTGTTLIACEQIGRKCFMMELDAHYCDVIIARWEKLTGLKAEKVTDGE